MKAQPLSIHNVLRLTVSSLVVLVVLLAGRELFTQWRHLSKVESLGTATVLSDRLFDATERLSVERDVAVTLLYAPDEKTRRSLKQRLEESRAFTNEAMEAVALIPQTNAATELEEIRRQIGARLPEIDVLRSWIDQAAERPQEKGDTELAQQWYDEISVLIAQTQQLWTGFVGHYTGINPVVTQHLRFKHLLRIISDYEGRERVTIGRLLVKNAAPGPEERIELLQGQGVIETCWKISKLLGEQSGLLPAIGSHYDDAHSHYMTLRDMMQGFYGSPGQENPYPLSAELWLELSDQAHESLDILRGESRKETQRYIESLQEKARRAIALHAAFLLLTLALSAWSFRVITRRVMQPINTMVQALLDTRAGKAVQLAPITAGRNDEIGKLAQVLSSFQESRERYRALVEASSQVIWVWREGYIDTTSPLGRWWEETTGQPAESIATYGWLDVVHPEDRERVKLIWQEAMEKKQNFEMEYRLRQRNGKYIYVEIKGVVLLAEDGEVKEFVGTLSDVTARKDAEAGLLDYMHALERSNKELDDFAYIASHDLKEPLRGIHNHSRFLMEDNAEKLDKESVDKLNRLIYLSQRMERLVNDLLYFSRLGRQDLAVQPANVNEIIKDISSTLEHFLAERKASITMPAQLPTVTCDIPRVTELFRNLVTNAVKYNSKPEKKVEIGFQRGAFYVRDNGDGIAPEFHEEIFRIFKRLQQAKEGAEEGTGVGLTFVKKIVERHGGRIWLESAPGQGTTFYFTLEGENHDIAQAA